MAEIAGKRKQAPGGIGRHKTGSKPVDIKMRQKMRIAENKQYRIIRMLRPSLVQLQKLRVEITTLNTVQ